MDLILPDTASPVSGKLWSKQMNAWEKAGARHTTVYSSSHSRTPATQAWLSLNDPPPGYRTIRGYAGRPAQRGPGSSGARTKSRAKWWTGRPGSGRWSTAQAARQRRLRSESSAPIPYRGAADSPFLGFPGPPEAFPRLPRPVLSHTPGPTPPGSMNHKHTIHSPARREKLGWSSPGRRVAPPTCTEAPSDWMVRGIRPSAWVTAGGRKPGLGKPTSANREEHDRDTIICIEPLQFSASSLRTCGHSLQGPFKLIYFLTLFWGMLLLSHVSRVRLCVPWPGMHIGPPAL